GVESGSRRYGSDRFSGGDNLRSPLSLEPERMAPPPALTSGMSGLHWSLYIFVASAVVAGTTYYFTAGGFSPRSGPQLPASAPAPAVQTAALGRQDPGRQDIGRQDAAAKQAPAAKPEAAAQMEARPTVARDDDPEVLREIAVQSVKTSKTARMTAKAG